MTGGTRALYLVMRTLGAVACTLPRRLALGIATAFARVVWRIYRLTPYRDFVSTNIRTAWPEMSARQANELGSDALVLLTRSIVELMRYPLLDQEGSRIIEISGREHLEASLAAGQGAIIVSAHFGNWELMGATLAREFGRVSALVQTPSKDAFARLFIEYRAMVGGRTISNTGPQSIRAALRALRAGEMLMLLVDQHGPAREATATFLGQRVWVPLGPFTLARRTGAAIVPARMVRGPGDRHRLILEPALDLDPDPQVNAQQIVDRYQAWIRANPDHWLWVHNRWEFLAEEASQAASQAPDGAIARKLTGPLAALVGALLLFGSTRAAAWGLSRPILVAYPDHLEVVDTLHPDTYGAVPLPGPADAGLYLPRENLLVVHIPSRSEVDLVDLKPFSLRRFEIIKTFNAPELGAYDLGFEQAAGRVLLGFGRTVIAHFGERTWDFEIGFDRPDEIPYPFTTGTTLYLPAGVFDLDRGELEFEATSLDPTGSAADGMPIALARRPVAMIANRPGKLLYVAEAGADGKGLLACIDVRKRTVTAQIPAPAPLTSLAWVDPRTLAALAGNRIGLYDVSRGAFVRWIPLAPHGRQPLRLFSAG